MTSDFEHQDLEKLLEQFELELELPAPSDTERTSHRDPPPFPEMPGYGARITIRDYYKQMEAYALHMHGLSATSDDPPAIIPPAVAKNYAQYLPGQASLDSLCMD